MFASGNGEADLPTQPVCALCSLNGKKKITIRGQKKTPKWIFLVLNDSANICLLLQIFYQHHHLCNLLWFSWSFLEEEKLIAVQQELFRSISDSVTLFDLKVIYLFVLPRNNLRIGYNEQQRQQIFSRNVVSNLVRLYVNSNPEALRAAL